MKRDDAKAILEYYREGDELTPRITRALSLLEEDAELGTWYNQKTGFDRQMAAALSEIRVPAALKSSLLAERLAEAGPVIIHPLAWWRRPLSLAAAAAIVLLLAGSAVFALSHPTRTFAQYRQEVVDESWGRAPHLDFETTDLAAFNRWLARSGSVTPVSYPSGLSDLGFRGGRTLDWQGHKVVLLCFGQGARHMHLFVMNDAVFPDFPPQAAPDFEKCNGWKTVSWNSGSRSYVLTGMNYLTFLRKFRHSGQWTMDG